MKILLFKLILTSFFLPEALPDQVEAETFQTKGYQYGKTNSRFVFTN